MRKKTLVLGASLKEERYSNRAVHRLRAQNIPVVAFGMKDGMIGGIIVDTEKKQYGNIDTVTLYLNPKRQKEFYEYILSLKPRRVIFNPGTENDEFVKILNQNEIEAEEACTLVLLSLNQF